MTSRRTAHNVGTADERRTTYSRMSMALARLDDAELPAILGTTSPPRTGWGTSQAGEYDGTALFVKTIPVTDTERAHPHSTRNRFRLPNYYHYGVGSAGFGVYRELASHVKATDWVLEGETDSFPLLYHARLMPRPAPADDPRFNLDDYVQRWNGSRAVANYMRARAAATHELWLVLEHFPNTVDRGCEETRRGSPT